MIWQLAVNAVNVMVAPGVFGRSRLVASISEFTRLSSQSVSTLFLTLCFKYSRSNGFPYKYVPLRIENRAKYFSCVVIF